MSKFDEITKKRNKQASVGSKKKEEKKATDLNEFEKETQAKKAVTFFREPFFSRCFVCARNFRIINDKMATCDFSFIIRPEHTVVSLCYVHDAGFKLDETKIAEVEKKYGVKVEMVEYPPWMLKKEEPKKEEPKKEEPKIAEQGGAKT
jgi:hypothetical protein